MARELAAKRGLVHLDLDSIAWKADQPGVREELSTSVERLKRFMIEHRAWVVEGCYGGLIEEAAKKADELIFMNPGVKVCQENCRSRPWEKDKYPSKEAQDANLAMLLDWVAQYETRSDEFSYTAHRRLFEQFTGKKTEHCRNLET